MKTTRIRIKTGIRMTVTRIRIKTGIHKAVMRIKIETRSDFPKFSGEEPRFYIYRANQFFKYQKTSEEHKVLLTNRVEGSPAKVFFGCFIGGPTEEIAAEITMLKPTNISMAIGLARLQEEKL